MESRVLLSLTLVKDINPITPPSDPTQITDVNGMAYFTPLETDPHSAYFGSTTLRVLWKSDGTAAGTSFVTRLFADDPPQNLTNVNGTLYFTGAGATLSPIGSHPPQLWKTDGTTTTPLTTFPAAHTIDSMTGVGGVVYFRVDGTQLWKTDGTAAGTAQVPVSFSLNSLRNLVNVGGKLYFDAGDAVHGTELWTSDGTAAGTTVAREITPGAAGTRFDTTVVLGSTLLFYANGSLYNLSAANPITPTGVVLASPLVRVGNSVFFAATDVAHGTELWKSDGTAGGTALVADVNPGTAGSNPTNLTAGTDVLYFTANDATHGTQIWKTDGTAAGTIGVTPGNAAVIPHGMATVGDTLIFTRPSTVNTRAQALWETDGTSSGTVQLSDGNGSVADLVSVGPMVMFAGDDGIHGSELWRTDGTAGGTYMVRDVNDAGQPSNPQDFAPVGNGRMLFNVTFGAQQGVWGTDGTADGTQRLSGLKLDAPPAAPPVLLGNAIYYIAGQSLWLTDGTEAGTRDLLDTSGIQPRAFANVGALGLNGSVLYFGAADDLGGSGLWRSDGTPQGTMLLKSLPGPAQNIVSLNGITYFLAGGALYRTDGTPAGTVHVDPAAPYTGATGLVRAGGEMFFQTPTDVWATDGTASGTIRLAALPSNAGPLFPVGNGVFYYGTDTAGDSQMWHSDGTSAGTLAVITVPPYPTTVAPFINVAATDTTLFFVGKDFKTLYKSDGTPAGTGAVMKFPGEIRSAGTANGLYYFAGSTNDYALYQSDGTAAGTIPADPQGPAPGLLAGSGTTLFAAAATTQTGNELWEVRAPAVPAAASDVTVTGVDGGDVALSWADHSDDESGFRVDRSTSPSFATVDQSVRLMPNVTQFMDHGLSPNATYYFRVVAYNSAGDAPAARATAATNAAPAAPSNLKATLTSETAVDLSWTDNSTNEQGFTIERSTSSAFQTVDESLTVPAGTTSFHDAGLAPGAIYYYRVSAFNAAGTSLYATTSLATPVVPFSPVVTIANDTASDVRLQWTDRSTIETGYRVERSPSSGFSTVDFTVTLPPNFTSFDDPSVQPHQTYYYRVTALGAASNSLPVVVTATTPDLPPAAPSNLQAQPLSSTEIDLTWTSTATNATGGFVIERSSGSGFVAIGRSLTPSFTDLSVSPLGVYTYRVEAMNDVGQSVRSNSATAQPPPSQLVNPVAQLPPAIESQASSSPSPVVTSNGIGYFVAYDLPHGRELWRTDGTAAGTYLLKEIGPGVTDANAENLTDVNGTLYFSAQLPSGVGKGLYKTDGTAAGTVLIKDVDPGGNAFYHDFVNFNGMLYFRAAGPGSSADLLWKSDGTAAGTVVVSTLDDWDANGGSYNRPLVVAGNRLFLGAEVKQYPGGIGLWVSDGTTAGTHLVAPTDTGPKYIENLTPAGDHVYFAAADAAGNEQVWVSDGTAADTFPLTSFDRFGLLNLQSSRWAVLDGRLFFTALVGGRVQLWTTDGTAAGTGLLLDPASTDNVQLDSPVTLGNQVYFATAGSSTKLWSTDGTPAGTSAVIDIGSSGAFDMTVANGALYFFAVPQSPTWQLWKSDGTPGGTAPVTSFVSTDTPGQLRPFKGGVTFTANDGLHGDELWASDGTAAGTALVKDIAFTTSPAHPDWLTNINGTVYFVAEDSTNQSQALWKTDGTAAGTVLIRQGAASNLVNWNGTLYFDGMDAVHGNELWKSDGTPQGTVLVQDIEPGVVSSSPTSLIPVGSKLFFFRGDPSAYGSLWVTDGSPTGAVHLSDSVIGGSFRAMGNELYFRMSNDLWKSDGTVQGTVPVVPSNASPVSPFDLTVYQGQLYFFAATSGQMGSDDGLYRTDGTAAGTVLVKGGFNPFSDNPLGNLTATDGSLYFTIHNNEIWKTDGTPAGTVVVTDIPLAQGNPAPNHFTAVGSTLYFCAQDGSDRTGFTGLWKTDGTAVGTIKVRSVAAPPAIDTAGSFALALGQELFFSTGADLWRSDGTPAGTFEVARPSVDLTGVPASLMQGPPAVAVGNNLLFSLYDPAGSRDLYSASAAPPAAPSGLTASPAASQAAVQLQWVDQSDNEAGFVIDRSRFADFSFIDASFFAPANSTGYTDSSVLGGAKYYYRVRAVDAGADSAEVAAAAPVTPHSVVAGRYIFYNNSLYDGRNPAANAADDAAVAPDKQALLPGQTATFANYTSYSRGINGIMIDVAGLAGTPTAADFSFRVGSSSDLSTWLAAPAPLSITVRPGAGTGGSSRVEIIWPDGAIIDRWLQVTLKADAITGLAAPDVFYFGNAVGESGNSPTDARVDAADEAGARNDPHPFTHPAPITNVHDYNRDGLVNAADQIIARNSAAAFSSGLELITAPTPAANLLSQSPDPRNKLLKTKRRR